MTSKILALTDALCNLIDLRLHPGQAHDLRGTADLIVGLACGKLLADRAFDANWLREALTNAQIKAVIPPKSNRRFPAEFDRDTYKWRHLIENFFGKLKEFRGIATRYCKTDDSFTAFISLVATVIRTRGTSTGPKICAVVSFGKYSGRENYICQASSRSVFSLRPITLEYNE